ncbi:Protein AEXR-1 [Aphelenchoides avenae]|nr:Protein AEXR-1 [Aphelenchus avenae]
MRSHQAVKYSGCSVSERLLLFQEVVDYALMFLTVLATVANVLVIVCALKLLRRTSDTMHVFVISLAIGNIMLTGIDHPVEILKDRQLVHPPAAIWSAANFFDWLGLAVSGISLTLLNLDKLVYFRWPLKYLTLTTNKAAYTCLTATGAALIFVSTAWIFRINYLSVENGGYVLKGSDGSFYELYLFVFCVVPATSSLLLSAYLFQLTRNRRRSPKLAIIANAQAKAPTSRAKLKSLAFIFTTTVWTAVTLAVLAFTHRIYCCYSIYVLQYGKMTCDTVAKAQWFEWILYYPLAMNPMVDPLLTLLLNAPYRRIQMQLFARLAARVTLRMSVGSESTDRLKREARSA